MIILLLINSVVYALKFSGSFVIGKENLNLRTFQSETFPIFSSKQRTVTTLFAKSISKSVGLSIGSAGLIILLANRLFSGLELVSDSQSRADIIGLIACSAVLLDWLSDEQVQVRERQSVPLVGFTLKEPEVSKSISKSYQQSVEWIMKSLLLVQSLTSCHVILDSNIVGHSGVVGYHSKLDLPLEISNLPILRDALEKRKQLYLPDLQVIFTIMFNLKLAIIPTLFLTDSARQSRIYLPTNQ